MKKTALQKNCYSRATTRCIDRDEKLRDLLRLVLIN